MTRQRGRALGRGLLGMYLSALVLLGWTWAANKYFPAANPPSTKVESGKQQPVPQPQVQSTPTAPKVLQSISAALAANPRVQIRTPSLEGSINLKGAEIDDLSKSGVRVYMVDAAHPYRGEGRQVVLFHDNLGIVDLRPETRVAAEGMPVQFVCTIANFSGVEKKSIF